MSFVLDAPDYASVKVIRCSPPAWMVHAVLEEKGADYRVRWLSFEKGEHRTPDMLARNPRGTIPVLSHGDIVVHETLAILQYLEHAIAEPALMPTSPATALTRLHESNVLKDKGMALFVALMRHEDAEPHWRALKDELQHWERALAQAPWVAGTAATLADFVVFTYVATACRLGLDLEPFPSIAAFYARAKLRPCIVATWPKTW